MTKKSEEWRAVVCAREMAERLSKGVTADETSFDGKRLHVLLGWIPGHCTCDHCRDIAKAYDTSRKIYTAGDLPHARAAARRVAAILDHVA
jgi:hypothetical protein